MQWDGSKFIIGTFTAFDGRNVRQEMLRAVVLARTRSPLIFPSAEQRGGYVPNVTYSCGALVPNGCVLLPYGVGDELTEFAVATIDDLLSVMVSN